MVMKRNKYKYIYVLFLSIILSICVFSFINRNDIYAHENRDNTNLPAWRTSLSKEEAEKMEGCEVFVDSDKKEAIIRPKNGASEGVISYSIENKRDDFTTIRHALIFNVPDEKFSVRFDKHVYLFDSVEAVANDTLFFQMHPGTINITDNLNIQFAKNLATFFMQDYRKSAGRLQYIKGIENWNTSHITDMKKMFNLASQLKGKLDLSKWDVSNVDNFNLMFSGVGNEDDSFVLDFSNKKFKNSVNVKNMFNSFRGVLIANNWSVKDPNGQKNPISELLNDPENSSILTFWNSKEKKYVGPSRHLLITDNTTILAKNKVEKYKFYKKPRVIYKDKSVELELPAVYDSRVDENGKPDTTKSASNDAMKVVKYQFDDALKKAILKLKTENPNLGLPNDYEAVPTVKIAKDDSPIALFQDYYLAEVKSETIEAKTIYTQDQSLAYMQEVIDSLPINGVKKIIMGQMEDGHWNPNLKSDETIRPAKNGKIRVGNKEVETIDVYPKTVYQADDKLDYKAT